MTRKFTLNGFIYRFSVDDRVLNTKVIKNTHTNIIKNNICLVSFHLMSLKNLIACIVIKMPLNL